MTIQYHGPTGNVNDPSAQAAVAQLAAIRAARTPPIALYTSCQQPIAWVQTASGARMPLDLATVEQRDGVTMALNHFATCPHGAAWSKKAGTR